MKTLTKEKLLRIGFVNKAYGFEGMLSCIVDSASPGFIASQRFLFMLMEGLPVPYFVESAEENGQELFIKFEDIDSEEQAKAFSRKDLFIEKEKSGRKERAETWMDLAGYTAYDRKYGELGIIEEVQEFPMQYIARCRVGDKEVLIPLNEKLISDILPDEKKITLDLPAGLLDIYLG